jgi:hypothetical protein
MSIFFDTLICEKCTLEKEKNLETAFKKAVCFMKKSMTRKQKNEEIFFFFTENDRLKIVSEDGRSIAYFNESIRIDNFCAKCEDVYYDPKQKCEFDICYVVDFKDCGGTCEPVLASPEEMLRGTFEEYCALRLEFKK